MKYQLINPIQKQLNLNIVGVIALTCTFLFNTHANADTCNYGQTVAIESAQDWQNFADCYNNQKMAANTTVILTEDIDMKGFSLNPVNNFSGVLNGNGHKISNTNNNLFLSIKGASIENLTIESANITTAGSILVGIADGGNITNVSVSGIIDLSNAGGVGSNAIGGLIAASRPSSNLALKIDKSSAHVNITSDYLTQTAGIGGLIGSQVPESTYYGLESLIINQSYSTGHVHANGGGLVGFVIHNNFSSSIAVSNSYSTLSFASPTYTGGLIGAVLNGTMAATSGTTIITNSYAANKIPENYTGGVVGIGDATCTNVYFDKDISNYKDDGVKTKCNSTAGLDTSEMKQQSTYQGWDFSHIWAIDSTINNGYPYIVKAN